MSSGAEGAKRKKKKRRRTPTKVDYNGLREPKRGKGHTTSLETFLLAEERTCDSEPRCGEHWELGEEGGGQTWRKLDTLI